MLREDAGLRDYLKILSKRRWAAVAVFFAVFSAVTVYTLTATPVYKSTARVFVDPGTSQNEISQQGQPVDTTSYIQTQLGILKSDSIARSVVKKMALDKEPPGGGGILGFFGLKDAPGPDKRMEAAVRTFQAKLSVDEVKNSNIINVSYIDNDPVLASAVANDVVQTFIERNLEMKVEPARSAITWLNSRLGEIKTKMTESSSQLQDFKRSRDLIQTDDKQANISIQALSDLNQKALEAQAARSAAEVKYHLVQKLEQTPDGLMTLPEVINNNVIQNLLAQQSALAKEYADASKKYGARHPHMIRLQNEMDALQAQIKSEVNYIVLSFKNSYDLALKDEQNIKAAFGQQKAEAMNYDKRSSEYDIMKQDVEGSRSIYDVVLKKFQESTLTGSMNMSNVQLLDQAVPLEKPFRPDKAMNLFLGLIIGLICGIAASFTVEFLDNTFKTPDDVEEYLRLPMLGVIPRIKNVETFMSDPKAPAGGVVQERSQQPSALHRRQGPKNSADLQRQPFRRQDDFRAEHGGDNGRGRRNNHTHRCGLKEAQAPQDAEGRQPSGPEQPPFGPGGAGRDNKTDTHERGGRDNFRPGPSEPIGAFGVQDHEGYPAGALAAV